jgi:ADP-heptose:LPS heptosyltransferase
MNTLVVRLDSLGDVLLAGPAVRAVAAGSDRVTLLVGPRGASAAELLPGVDRIIVWRCPWIDADPGPVAPQEIHDLAVALEAERFDAAVVLTSFHQSALPTALLLRLAGIPRITAISDDYPGTLLDVRIPPDWSQHEVDRAVGVAAAAGFRLQAGDSGRLDVRRPLPSTHHLGIEKPFVVLHPGTSVPARAWPRARFAAALRLLESCGHHVVVTGSVEERHLTASVVAGSHALNLGGRTDLAQLASVLDDADAVVVGNTGPAHLAAAVGTPVVSLFAPTVSAHNWRPYGVPAVLLGDQTAPCRGSRARSCPVEGHPCLSEVDEYEVVAALARLTTGLSALQGQGRRTA